LFSESENTLVGLFYLFVAGFVVQRTKPASKR
jgi:hypothetical protein